VARRLAVLVASVVAPVLVVLPTGARAGQSRVTDARYGVGLRVLDLVDRSRDTPADPRGQTPVAASRTRALPTLIYYPAVGAPAAEPQDPVAVADARAAKGRFPVILFSHGSPGSPEAYAAMLERWAAEGYVVVTPTYPVSSTSGPTEVGYRDQRDQVRDARYVLDRVLALNRVPVRKGGFDGHLDPKRVAVAGHSMGGLTTLALVSDCCRDRRVKAAVVLAGVAENEDGGPVIRDPSGPILFAHSTLDFAVRYRESKRAFAAASRPKYLLEIRFPIGGVLAHLLPVTPGLGQVSTTVAAVVDDFLAGYLRRDRAARSEIPAVARSDRYVRLRFTE
jgi:dienelactone hydrolase